MDNVERDMRTLRDTMIAREEDWERAAEREETYRLQLSRLTAEGITTRHLLETRNDELKTFASSLRVRCIFAQLAAGKA